MKDNSKIEILIIKSITKIICDLKSMWKIIQLFFFLYILYFEKDNKKLRTGKILIATNNFSPTQ